MSRYEPQVVQLNKKSIDALSGLQKALSKNARQMQKFERALSSALAATSAPKIRMSEPARNDADYDEVDSDRPCDCGDGWWEASSHD